MEIMELMFQKGIQNNSNVLRYPGHLTFPENKCENRLIEILDSHKEENLCLVIFK